MSTLTTRLGIKKPQDADPFLTADFDTNYDLIDSYPGVWVCTSTTLPAWGAAQAGQLVVCTDTRTPLEWTGAAWRDPLVVPALWSLSTTLSTSLSPGTSGAAFSLGTVSSTRACAALANLQVVYRPLPLGVPYTIVFTLTVNGVSGPSCTLARDAGVQHTETGTYGSALTSCMTGDAVSLNAGSNSIGVTVTYSAPATYVQDSSTSLPGSTPNLFVSSGKATLLAASLGPN